MAMLVREKKTHTHTKGHLRSCLPIRLIWNNTELRGRVLSTSPSFMGDPGFNLGCYDIFRYWGLSWFFAALTGKFPASTWNLAIMSSSHVLYNSFYWCVIRRYRPI